MAGPYPRLQDFSLIRTNFIRTSSLNICQNLRTVMKTDKNLKNLLYKTAQKFCSGSNFKNLRTVEAQPIVTGSYKTRLSSILIVLDFGRLRFWSSLIWVVFDFGRLRFWLSLIFVIFKFDRLQF